MSAFSDQFIDPNSLTASEREWATSVGQTLGGNLKGAYWAPNHARSDQYDNASGFAVALDGDAPMVAALLPRTKLGWGITAVRVPAEDVSKLEEALKSGAALTIMSNVLVESDENELSYNEHRNPDTNYEQVSKVSKQAASTTYGSGGSFVSIMSQTKKASRGRTIKEYYVVAQGGVPKASDELYKTVVKKQQMDAQSRVIGSSLSVSKFANSQDYNFVRVAGKRMRRRNIARVAEALGLEHVGMEDDDMSACTDAGGKCPKMALCGIEIGTNAFSALAANKDNTYVFYSMTTSPAMATGAYLVPTDPQNGVKIHENEGAARMLWSNEAYNMAPVGTGRKLGFDKITAAAVIKDGMNDLDGVNDRFSWSGPTWNHRLVPEVYGSAMTEGEQAALGLTKVQGACSDTLKHEACVMAGPCAERMPHIRARMENNY